MKVSVSQEKLLTALGKGGLAALSATAQSETSNMAPIIKSVKIDVKETAITIESVTNLVISKVTIPVEVDGGIEVSEEGSVMVPAKELTSWVQIQGKGSTILMALKKLKTPEKIALDGDDEEESFSISKIGMLKLASKDENKTIGKWELDCYDTDQGTTVDFDSSQKGEKLFDIQAEQFQVALGKVKFATLDKDYQHIMDSVSIQSNNGDIYFAATDTKRCALYKPTTVENVDSDKPTLISVALLEPVLKILDKDLKTELYYDSEKCKVYISQENIEVRIACPDESSIAKFPKVVLLLDKPYAELGTINRNALSKILKSSSMINKRSALFDFNKDKGQIIVTTISEDGSYKPNVSSAPVQELDKDCKSVWGVTHLLESLKTMKSEDIQFFIPDNMRTMKILGLDDPNFIYFIMAIDNPKYADV